MTEMAKTIPPDGELIIEIKGSNRAIGAYPKEIKEILSIMEKDTASGFNPFLLENFMRRVDKELHAFC
jgi:hypothetical protein